MKTVRMVQPAEQEMLDAAAYYELQVSELGQDFLKKIASAVADIGENPERWPIVRQNVRRPLCIASRTDCCIEKNQEEVVVLAVAHLHRHPTYWVARSCDPDNALRDR